MLTKRLALWAAIAMMIPLFLTASDGKNAGCLPEPSGTVEPNPTSCRKPLAVSDLQGTWVSTHDSEVKYIFKQELEFERTGNWPEWLKAGNYEIVGPEYVLVMYKWDSKGQVETIKRTYVDACKWVLESETYQTMEGKNQTFRFVSNP